MAIRINRIYITKDPEKIDRSFGEKWATMERALVRIWNHTSSTVCLCRLGLTSLPFLPNHITILCCNGNQLTSLPQLPPNLTQLWCDDNQLTSLPPLPTGLLRLQCTNNQLSSLPDLPDTLRDLACEGNKLPPRLHQELPHEYIVRMGGEERCSQRVKLFKEELMMNRWHPSRVLRLLEAGVEMEDM